MKIKEVIDIIYKECGVTVLEPTVDMCIIGNPDNEVTGVAVTFMATAEVINKAYEAGCNFIITHEPTFYTAPDISSWESRAVKVKKDLLKKENMTVWRIHDHMHAMRPDMIYTGMLQKLGWQQYVHGDQRLIDIPTRTAEQLVAYIKDKLGLSGVRLAGIKDMLCSRVGFLLGAYSLGLTMGPGMETSVTRWIEENNVDVLLAGEMLEWTTCSYIRDTAAYDKPRALIVMGHEGSEEAGMEYLTKLLQKHLQNIKVLFISSGEPYVWL